MCWHVCLWALHISLTIVLYGFYSKWISLACFLHSDHIFLYSLYIPTAKFLSCSWASSELEYIVSGVALVKVKPKETITGAWECAVWSVACQSDAVLKLLGKTASTLIWGFGMWSLRPSADSSNDYLARAIGGRGATKFCVGPIITEIKQAGGLVAWAILRQPGMCKFCSIVTDEQKILDHVFLLDLVSIEPPTGSFWHALYVLLV